MKNKVRKDGNPVAFRGQNIIKCRPHIGEFHDRERWIIDFFKVCVHKFINIVLGRKSNKNHEFKKGSIITDAVGVKTHFLNEAMDLLKDKDVEFVSGHPMAGRENKGYLYASKEVFQGANYILIQHEENSKSAIAMMEQFVSNLGFHSVKIMSPQAHDEIISFTSQLPHVIAVSLIDSDNQKYDTGKYIGDSYRDLTRIANINEDLWTELFFTNKNNLLKSIQGFEDQLDILKKAIKEEDADTLKAMFIESSKRRKNLEK